MSKSNSLMHFLASAFETLPKLGKKYISKEIGPRNSYDHRRGSESSREDCKLLRSQRPTRTVQLEKDEVSRRNYEMNVWSIVCKFILEFCIFS